MGQWEGDEASICGSQLHFTRLTQIFGFPRSLHRIKKCTSNLSGSFFFEHNPGKLFEQSKHMWVLPTFETPDLDSQNYNFKIIKIIMAIILALDLMWDKWCLFVVGLIKEHHPHQDLH